LTNAEKMELRRQNEEVLRNLGHLPGVEYAPRRVDFNLVFASEADGPVSKDWVDNLGFGWEDRDDSVNAGTFEATARKILTPDVDNISDTEIALIEALSSFGGYVGGWEYFGDTVH
jgi:hypothetical protein